MMGLIFAKIIFFLVVLALASFLIHDICYTIMYFRGKKTVATVMEKVGIKEVPLYGQKIYGQQYTVYKVQIEGEDGKIYSAQAARKEYHFEPGWHIGVRIYDGKNGKQIIDDIYPKRLLIFFLMAIGGVLLGMFGYYYTTK